MANITPNGNYIKFVEIWLIGIESQLGPWVSAFLFYNEESGINSSTVI